MESFVCATRTLTFIRRITGGHFCLILCAAGREVSFSCRNIMFFLVVLLFMINVLRKNS